MEKNDGVPIFKVYTVHRSIIQYISMEQEWIKLLFEP